MEIVNRILKTQGLQCRSLSVSPLIESLTPLVLNIARYNKMRMSAYSSANNAGKAQKIVGILAAGSGRSRGGRGILTRS